MSRAPAERLCAYYLGSKKTKKRKEDISWIAVVFPTKHTAIFRPFGGMSQMPHFMLFGIHSMKYEEFLFWTLSICSSTSFDDILPRKRPAAVK